MTYFITVIASWNSPVSKWLPRFGTAVYFTILCIIVNSAVGIIRETLFIGAIVLSLIGFITEMNEKKKALNVEGKQSFTG